jgi:malonate-semialdehyde dehydrogenase (acetylating)/methylmalonate-semialdehyde dehydrogenase
VSRIEQPSSPVVCGNFVEGRARVLGTRPRSTVRSPYTGAAIAEVVHSSAEDVHHAVDVARQAAKGWGETPIKERCAVLFRFRALVERELERLSHSVAAESGKTLAEARAGVLKGIECVEFATAVQNLDTGGRLEVSRGVSCAFRREPLGVVAGITPFNFPAMVPMWMFPLALAAGNAFILKPSEKVPRTPLLLAELLHEAGLPQGVFGVVQGTAEAVHALVDHPEVAALGFVGSSAVAHAVYTRATALGKRALCLGGAKNHLVVVPDADVEVTAQAVTDSFTGCAGQRCMAGSVLLAVGDVEPIIEAICRKAAGHVLGETMGAIIDGAARERIRAAIDAAERAGARVRLDGRGKRPAEAAYQDGNWMGPTVLDGVSPTSEAACTEIFGPVLSVVRVGTLDEALRIEAANPYGNAASIFTRSGATAHFVAEKVRAAMVGINVGVPVPREPFSFGGMGTSRFGHGDITGEDGLSFWSLRKKITEKWAVHTDATWMG